MTHPADADHSAHHTLSDAQLDDMLDAAIDTANAISAYHTGRRWRRLARPIEGEDLTRVDALLSHIITFSPPPPPSGEVRYPPEAQLSHPDPAFDMADFMEGGRFYVGPTLHPIGDPREAQNWQAEIFDQAKERAMAERIKLPVTDVVLIRDLVAVTESRIERLRETAASTHPIIDKALTSMSLGLLGLVKAVDDDSSPDDHTVASG